MSEPEWRATFAKDEGPRGWGPDWARREVVTQGWTPPDGARLYSLELSVWSPSIDKPWCQEWLRGGIAPRVVAGGRVDGLIWHPPGSEEIWKLRGQL